MSQGKKYEIHVGTVGDTSGAEAVKQSLEGVTEAAKAVQAAQTTAAGVTSPQMSQSASTEDAERATRELKSARDEAAKAAAAHAAAENELKAALAEVQSLQTERATRELKSARDEAAKAVAAHAAAENELKAALAEVKSLQTQFTATLAATAAEQERVNTSANRQANSTKHVQQATSAAEGSMAWYRQELARVSHEMDQAVIGSEKWSALAREHASLNQRLAASMQRGGAETNRLGQGMMQLAYIMDDAQYGFRGVVNNIPPLLMGLGLGGGLTAALSMVAVGLNVAIEKFGLFQSAQKQAKESAERLAEAEKRAAQIMQESRRKAAEEASLEIQRSAERERSALDKTSESIKSQISLLRQKANAELEVNNAEAAAELARIDNLEMSGIYGREQAIEARAKVRLAAEQKSRSIREQSLRDELNGEEQLLKVMEERAKISAESAQSAEYEYKEALYAHNSVAAAEKRLADIDAAITEIEKEQKLHRMRKSVLNVDEKEWAEKDSMMRQSLDHLSEERIRVQKLDAQKNELPILKENADLAASTFQKLKSESEQSAQSLEKHKRSLEDLTRSTMIQIETLQKVGKETDSRFEYEVQAQRIDAKKKREETAEGRSEETRKLTIEYEKQLAAVDKLTTELEKLQADLDATTSKAEQAGLENQINNKRESITQGKQGLQEILQSLRKMGADTSGLASPREAVSVNAQVTAELSRLLQGIQANAREKAGQSRYNTQAAATVKQIEGLIRLLSDGETSSEDLSAISGALSRIGDAMISTNEKHQSEMKALRTSVMALEARMGQRSRMNQGMR